MNLNQKQLLTQINQREPYSRLCQRSKLHLQHSDNLKIPSDSNLEALHQQGYIGNNEGQAIWRASSGTDWHGEIIKKLKWICTTGEGWVGKSSGRESSSCRNWSSSKLLVK